MSTDWKTTLDEVASHVHETQADIVTHAQSRGSGLDVSKMVEDIRDDIEDSFDDIGIEFTPETVGASLAVVAGLQSTVEHSAQGNKMNRLILTGIAVPATLMALAQAYQSTRIEEADVANELDLDDPVATLGDARLDDEELREETTLDDSDEEEAA